MASTSHSDPLNLTSKSRVLLLGSGYVVEPCIQFLTRDPFLQLTIASNEEEKLKTFGTKYNCQTKLCILPGDLDILQDLVSKHEVVISLLPRPFHPLVAEVVVELKRHLVTASYVSEEMSKLHSKAKERQLIFLNEMGLDPGIDHMLALRDIQEVHRMGGKVTSYTSWCGGLPAPECANNPLFYKFTWHPVGMLTNIWNSYKFMKNGNIIHSENGFLAEHLENVALSKDLNFEGIPNRDSLTYREVYNIPEVHTLLRGSIRYTGHMRVLNALKDLKLITKQALEYPHQSNWSSYLLHVLGRGQEEKSNLKQIVTEVLGDENLVASVTELGILSDETIEILASPVETLAQYLEVKYPLRSDERDLVVLVNQIEADLGVEGKSRITTSLLEYGTPNGPTAMSRCVGLLAGIGCKMVLLGMISDRGVVIPTHPDIIKIGLEALEREGISFKIEREKVS